jgi:hypothetical protein
MEHRSEIGRFCFCCKMFDRKTWNFFADFVSVVTNGCCVFYTSCCSLACHVSIADWFVPFIGREYVDTWHIDTWQILFGRPTNMRNLKKKLRTTRWVVGGNILGGNILTRGILTRGSYWSDGPRLPSRNLPCRNDKLWKSTFATSDL